MSYEITVNAIGKDYNTSLQNLKLNALRKYLKNNYGDDTIKNISTFIRKEMILKCDDYILNFKT